MNCPVGMCVDHIDGNPLNNCKNNLRICTQAENQMNRGKTKNNKSGCKGVYWAKQLKKWKSQITINNKQKHLGYYNCPIEAAKAYNSAALLYHKEFAKLNTI